MALGTIVLITTAGDRVAIFKISSFKKNFKKHTISDIQLLNAAHEVQQGKYEADLGGGVIKKTPSRQRAR
ncbi:type II toxin-antitoxin system RelE/ParE family toxin [Morganella psychrotolerans]|uniref:type II toxin-antitoxin system RelE/ParE family toxin n=1 Tax=Morganella psychrotolerans TaxID=368603 RepID=UPI002286F7DC|nr:type II toxin-antitoxin system RelE/ParE family toxin [Morganella psychrotolerans]